MHQRSWLALLSLPLVTTFSLPVLQQSAPSKPAPAAKAAPQDPLAGLADIQDVLSLVREHYVDAPDIEKVLGGGIQNVLEQAHPFNSLLSPEDLRLPDPGPGDVGLVLVKRVIYAQVVAVRPGSPAAQAGIQPGDVIRKIDGDSIGPLSVWHMERRLRGPVGSSVTLLRYAGAEAQLGKVTLQRSVIPRAPLGVRKEDKATLITLPDLATGRAAELKALLPTLDHALPLVVDLRNCAGGDLAEAALVAGLLGQAGPLATVQEPGPKETPLTIAAAGLAPFPKLALLTAPSTVGPAEALAAGLKKQQVRLVGERTAGLGVERMRIPLKQGGAVDLVTRRWVGAGGEKLDRQGVTPQNPLRGLKAGEDPLPKVLPLLDQPIPAPGVESEAKKVASAWRSSGRPDVDGEVS